MARPIVETPVLKGRDAEEFNRNIETSKNKLLPEEVIIKMKEDYEKVHKILAPDDNESVRV